MGRAVVKQDEHRGSSLQRPSCFDIKLSWAISTSLMVIKAPQKLAGIIALKRGVVKHSVLRLKLLKRQMYGRAKFDLLRFLHPPWLPAHSTKAAEEPI